MNPFSAIFATYKVYFMAAVLAISVGGSFWAAWSWKSALAEKEKNKAVAEAVEDAVDSIQNQLSEEKTNRQYFQTLAQESLASLSQKMDNISGTQAKIAAGIAKERARDPKFYTQPLPPAGRDEWIRARALAVQPAASSSTAASSPSSSLR